MLESARSGGDVYSAIAAIAFNTTYENCLEFFPEGTPIRKDAQGHWEMCDKSVCEKLADGHTDTNYAGKNRRTQSKSIVLGICYGRGINSIAQQLKVTPEEAEKIYNDVLNTFKGLERLKNESEEMARTKGFVTTLWGRKRRLPDMKLPKYSILYSNEYSKATGLTQVPPEVVNHYLNELGKCRSKNAVNQVKEEARQNGIHIRDNGAFIARAQRQCVNSRVQGRRSTNCPYLFNLITQGCTV